MSRAADQDPRLPQSHKVICNMHTLASMFCCLLTNVQLWGPWNGPKSTKTWVTHLTENLQYGKCLLFKFFIWTEMLAWRLLAQIVIVHIELPWEEELYWWPIDKIPKSEGYLQHEHTSIHVFFHLRFIFVCVSVFFSFSTFTIHQNKTNRPSNCPAVCSASLSCIGAPG